MPDKILNMDMLLTRPKKNILGGHEYRKNPEIIRNTIFLLVIFIFSLYTSLSFASYQKNLWPIWQVFNPLNNAVIQHDEWQDFLTRNLIMNEENIALLDYRHINLKDIQLLETYIKKLSEIKIHEYNRKEQLAYWLNLYNAVTVQVIIKYSPVSNIQDINISPGLFSIGPWGANLVEVNHIRLSLDEIENRIIRPIWNDPRTLYAMNNGSIGGPNLHSEAFTGENLDNQLNQISKKYINSLRAVQIIDNRLVLSKIYEWFKDDFGVSEENIIKHLIIFADPPLAKELKNMKEIDRYVYNWHLNSPPRHDKHE